jgi:hypothetical protein
LRSGRDALVVLAFALCLSLASTPAAFAADPPDKAVCARAYEQAQRHRQARELRAARADLQVCSRSECPAWVRRDCGPWLSEVEAALPSIVILARTADGGALTNVRLIVDGTLVTSQLTTEPLPLDPGEHHLVLEAIGVARVEQHLKLREGDRERRIEVTFAPAPAPPPPVEPAKPPEPPARQPPEPRTVVERPVPSLVYVLGSTGIVVTALGGYFQVAGMEKRDDLVRCEPACVPSDVEDARRTLWAGNIMLGVGVVALVSAAVLYFTRPSVERPVMVAPR